MVLTILHRIECTRAGGGGSRCCRRRGRSNRLSLSSCGLLSCLQADVIVGMCLQALHSVIDGGGGGGGRTQIGKSKAKIIENDIDNWKRTTSN